LAARTKEPTAAALPRFPAEWEPHAATWLAWPHNRSDWPGRFAPIAWVYGEIVKRLVPSSDDAAGERVRLVVSDARARARAERLLARLGVDLSHVDFFVWRTDRSWLRDSGPLFVERDGGLAVARFRFNGWAKYPNWRHDVRLPERAAKRLGLPLHPATHDGRPVVLEGGAIDSNGRGTLLATEECLLDPEVQVRNPGFGRRDYETVFRRELGISNTIWLGKGIHGDDTHGHVDDLCRFVGPRTIVLCREQDRRDDNYRPLEENRERLEGARLEDGSRPQVVFLPMPAPLFFDRLRLPASYANFYIANAAVLVPTFNDPNDRLALGILAELFADRPVVGIHAADLVWGLGTLHCASQQEPAGGTARRDR